jgi:CRISPR-associated endonuclease/helicase Cas3
MNRRVILISDSSHKALREEKRMLDRYLLRLSDTVWGGRLSQEGEQTVRERLLKTRSPYRAVLCLDAATLTPRWHVGRRRTFLPDGRQAFGERTSDLPPEPRSPSADASRNIAILAALCHDLGKATNVFQRKLRHATSTSKNKPQAEPFRHEIVSTDVLLKAAQHPAPCPWRDLLAASAKALLASHHPETAIRQMQADFNGLSAVAQAARVVATHHRKASLDIHDHPPAFGIPERRPDFETSIDSKKRSEPAPDADAATGPHGSPWDPSDAGTAWRGRLQHLLDGLKQTPSVVGADLFPHAALVVADHLSSSRPDSRRAELDRHARNVLAKSKDPERNARVPRPQTLLGHLQQVADLAGAFHDLALGRRRLGFRPDDLPPTLTDLPLDGPFAWQGKVLRYARQAMRPNRPAFIVLTAGTGSGKTRVAPALLACQTDLVRITALLPLRSLTRQTRAAYRRLGLPDHAVAIKIGGSQPPDPEDPPATDAPEDEPLFDREIDAAAVLQDQIGRLPSALASHLRLASDGLDPLARLVAVPFLTATVDLMTGLITGEHMRGTSSVIRLADTDLLLDEIDVLSPEDQAVLCRLTRACGAYGGRACLVSATIPPETAVAMAASYADGVRIRSMLQDRPEENDVDLLVLDNLLDPWHDRRKADDLIRDVSDIFGTNHPLDGLQKAVRRATIEKPPPATRLVDVLPAPRTRQHEPCARDDFAVAIMQALPRLAQHDHPTACGRRMSVGFLRMGTVYRAMGAARSLSQRPVLPDGTVLRVLAYHAAFGNEARARIESLLDDGLLRATGRPPPIAEHHAIRRVLDSIDPGGKLCLLVVCTSILETGRDHDYDFGVHETTSVRSLIQAAGRIRRHRNDPPPAAAGPNLLVVGDPLGKNPYAYPGPLTPTDLCHGASPSDLSKLSTPQAIGLGGRGVLPIAALHASRMAELERNLRHAFLCNGPEPQGIRLAAGAVPVLRHLEAARDDATLWMAQPPKPLRFRRPAQGMIDVLAWTEGTAWMARRERQGSTEEAIISLPRPRMYAPGPAMLDLGLEDLLPSKRLPLRLAVRSQAGSTSRQPLRIFHLHGHPALGWLASADGQDPSHGWLGPA